MDDEVLAKREVGWLVTKEHDPLEGIESRVGWGQLRVHADSSEQTPTNTVFVDKSLTEHMIPEVEQVRWRSFEDDGVASYDGIIRLSWIFVDDDLSYNVKRFNEADVGATQLYFSADDIIAQATIADEPSWVEFAINNAHLVTLKGEQGSWVQLY